MVICAAVGCGSNSNTSKELIISTATRRGIKHCMEAQITARKVASR